MIMAKCIAGSATKLHTSLIKIPSIDVVGGIFIIYKPNHFYPAPSVSGCIYKPDHLYPAPLASDNIYYISSYQR